ncbi:hypothetical protein [Halorientalis halophila]|uniref:hypothetical protein n=1 Tax=Halorientalis halophila TaxID=3108499 RepID=UPI00300AC8EF
MNPAATRPAAVAAAAVIAVALAAVTTPAAADPVAVNATQPSTASEPQVSLDEVTVTPSQPAPGELIEISARISNAETSPEVADVRSVRLGSANDANSRGSVSDVGTLTPGGSVTVPLTTTFEEPGVKRLELTVVAETTDEELIRFNYPVTVVVTESGPKMSVDVTGSVGNARELTVNVSNGGLDPIRNLDLVVDGTNVAVDDTQRLDAVLEAGQKRSFDFSGTVPEAGAGAVTATLTYTNAMGQTRTLERAVQLDPASDDRAVDGPQLALAVAEGLPGATRPVNVTVANGLDADVSQVAVSATSPVANFTVAERVRSRLDAGETTTFEFPARVAESGTYPVNVTFAYTDGATRKRVTERFRATFDEPANPGEVVLTGVEAVDRGGSIEISATASNVGSDDVESVVVSTADAEAVGTANRFVGSIDASDFSSFGLSTTVTGNVSAVPVEVSYVVDGVERTYTTEIPVTNGSAGRPQSPQQGGFPLIPVLVVVGVIAAVVVYRRRG